MKPRQRKKDLSDFYRPPDVNDRQHDQHHKTDLLQKGCLYEDEKDIDIKTCAGEYQYATEQNVGRYTYVDTAHIESTDPDVREWMRGFLVDYEDAFSHHDFDLGC